MRNLFDHWGTQKANTTPILSGSPQSILSWNVNGLVTRINTDAEFQSFGSFITKLGLPDVVCLQEVKLAAEGPPGCTKGDGRPRQRGRIREDTKAYRLEAEVVRKALTSIPWREYDQIWSLSDWRYAGQLVLVKKSFKRHDVKYSLRQNDAGHHPDGRVILIEFDDYILLATYACNSGWEDSSWNRRAVWDNEICDFLKRRRGSAKPLVWTGDLNVAPATADQTHPEWFRAQLPESIRYQSNKSQLAAASIPQEHRGQPGCTEFEASGFKKYLETGSLVDMFRQLHADGPPKLSTPEVGRDGAATSVDVDSANFTWRGSAGVKSSEYGRYFAKAMRIDHFVSGCIRPMNRQSRQLVEKDLAEKVESCQILGFGRHRVNFFGSDHSPIIMRFRANLKRALSPPSIFPSSPHSEDSQQPTAIV